MSQVVQETMASTGRITTAVLAGTPAASRLKTLSQGLAPFLFLILISVVLSLVSENFLTVRNIITILLQISVVGILAVGQTMVLITAGVDLSVGAVVGLSGVVSAILISSFGLPLGIAFPLGVLVGLACGLVNGLLITSIKMPPFIATLGMMGVARGLAQVLSGGIAIYDLPQSFGWLGNARLLGLPVPVLVLAGTAVVVAFVLRKTPLGRYAYAVGSNVEAARMSGVNVSRQLVKVYALSGLLAGLAGVILASRTTVGSPSGGEGYELDAIAACVIGGTSLFGGVGTVVGTVIGAALMGLIRNGCNLLNVSTFWQLIVVGIIIWIAVAWDQYRRKQAT